MVAITSILTHLYLVEQASLPVLGGRVQNPTLHYMVTIAVIHFDCCRQYFVFSYEKLKVKHPTLRFYLIFQHPSENGVGGENTGWFQAAGTACLK